MDSLKNRQTQGSEDTSVEWSTVEHLTRHITGHYRDDLPSQSLDWCKYSDFSTNHLTDVDKTKHNYDQQQQNDLNKHAENY